MAVAVAIVLRALRLALAGSSAALFSAACGGEVVESVCARAQDKILACRMGVFGGTPRLPSWPGEECDGRDLCLARCTNRTSCAVIMTLADITSFAQEVPSPADWEGFHECVDGCGEP